MNKLNDAQIKQAELGILEHFDQMCKEKNLRYSIAFGTMIGCIRHGGFIPWDDDIDVYMPREDYEKLLALKYKSEKYEVRSYRYSKDFYYPFAKMVDTDTLIKEQNRCEKNMGIYIDIFPLDYVPENIDYSTFFDKSVKHSKKLLSYGVSRKNTNEKKALHRRIIRTMYYYAIHPFRKQLLRHGENKYIKATKTDSDLLMCQFWTVKREKCHSDKCWNNIVELPFENLKVSVLSDYDAILRGLYGDYMKLPPKEQQVNPHGLKVWQKDKSKD